MGEDVAVGEQGALRRASGARCIQDEAVSSGSGSGDRGGAVLIASTVTASPSVCSN